MKNITYIFLTWLSIIQAQANKDTLYVNKILAKLDSINNNDFYPYLSIAQEAYQQSKNLNYGIGIAKSGLYLGIIYSQMSDWDNSIKYLYEAEKEAKKHQNNILEDVLTNIAIVYGNTNEHKKSLEIYEEIRQLLSKNTDTNPIAWVKNFINTGKTYFNIGQYKEAIIWNKKALEISKKENILLGIAVASNALSADYLELYILDSAMIHGNIANKISSENGFKRLELASLQNIGSTFLYGKKYNKALPFFQRAVEFAVETKDIYNMAENILLISAVYDSLGDYKRSLLYLKNHKQLNDSIYKQEKREELLRLETLYETEKKENQIKDLARQNDLKEAESNQKSLVILAIILAVILAATVAFLLFIRYKSTQKNIALQKERERAQSELAALKAQMNPHFIFNGLNSVQEIFLLGDKKLANKHLGQFAELTRMILNASLHSTITLEEELKLLKMYVELESHLLDGNFKYDFFYNEADYDVEIPPMLVQPLVENAIKHGLMHKQGEKYLKISFQYNQEKYHMLCVVEDNGIGRNASAMLKANQPNSHTSFSTNAIDRRLSLLNDSKDQKINIQYNDLNDNGISIGTKVVLEIPLT